MWTESHPVRESNLSEKSMSLEGLEQAGEIGSLAVGPNDIAGMMKKARRKLSDARSDEISAETRLEQAYTVIFTCALIALRAMGYRILNMTAMHYLALETLRYTLGTNEKRIEYFQSLRTLRHRDIYAPDFTVELDDVDEAISEAEALLEETSEWLRLNYPHLIR